MKNNIGICGAHRTGMLNLQASKLLHERTLMNPMWQQEKNLESIYRAHLIISSRLTELLNKYNIT